MSAERKIATRFVLAGALAFGETFAAGCGKVTAPLNVNHIKPIVAVDPTSINLGYEIRMSSGRRFVSKLSFYPNSVTLLTRTVVSERMRTSASSHTVGLKLDPKTGNFEIIDEYGGAPGRKHVK